MQPDHPHRFFKPFNGIDAIGRFSILAAFCAAALISALAIEGELRHIGDQEWIALILISIGIMIFFGCGIGLCLRKNVARILTMILYVLFTFAVVIAIGIVGLDSGWWMLGDVGLTFLINFAGAIALAVLVILYLAYPEVRTEFCREEKPPVATNQRYTPFIVGLIVFSACLLLTGLLNIGEFVDEFERSIRHITGHGFDLRAMNDVALLAFFALILFGSPALIIFVILAFLRVRGTLTFGKIVGIAYIVLPALIFISLSIDLMWWDFHTGSLWFLALAFVSTYPGWSVFRYMRSEQAKKTFTR